MVLLGACLFVLLSVLLAGWVYQRLGARHDARVLPPPGRLFDAGGRRLHALVLGEGVPPVVFEAGIAASSLNWRAVQARVAGFTTTWAYDRAGYGWSDATGDRATAGAASARLKAALDVSGLRPPFVLVGHSFGGYVVQVFATRHPESVAGLVLVDTITPDDWEHPTPRQRRELRGGAAFARIGALLASIGVVRLALRRLGGGAPGIGQAVLGTFGPTAEATVRRVVGEVTKLPADVLPAVQAHWSRPRSFLTMARHFDALPASAAEVRLALEPLSDWPFPVVVISATSCSPDQMRAHGALAARSPWGRHVGAESGHWVHLDQPDVIVDAVRDLVARARGTA